VVEIKTILKFIKGLTVQYLVLAIICAAVFGYIAPQHYFPMLPVVFIYFYLLNFFSYFILVKTHNLPTIRFSKYFMLLSMVKFFGSLGFVVLYIIFARETLIPFLVIFIILYFHSLFQLVREYQFFLAEKNSR
jgi:hypothetical protein